MRAAALSLLVPAANAVGIWGQCGGKNYSGSKICDAGLICVYGDDYYSQCRPGTTTLTTSTRSTSSSTPAPAPGTSTTKSGTTSTTSAGGGSTTDAGNIFLGKQIYANPQYASEISAYAIPSLTGTLKARATAVANTGTFLWLDTAAKVPTMDTYLTNIEKLNAAGASPPVLGAFVVYDLPNRDCSALASNGEYQVADGGLNKYYAYIDSIAAILKKHSSTSVALVIEPDSLGNLVTNLNVARCVEAQPAYEAGVIYAMKTLNLPNVSMYLDAGHAGWLGWAANLGPAAQLFARLYKSAGSPKAVRGLVTNVSNYNGFSLATAPSYTQGNSNYDEKHYINAIAPLLTSNGFPAHFITDTGRNGVQPTSQQAWGDWCNVKGTGFGVRPTTNTGDALVDAFVWVKPGGESDGTSDASAKRYDAHCGYADALQPAPEAGTWFEAYFEQLLRNANPAF